MVDKTHNRVPLDIEMVGPFCIGKKNTRQFPWHPLAHQKSVLFILHIQFYTKLAWSVFSYQGLNDSNTQPFVAGYHPSYNWSSSRHLTSMIVRKLAFPF